MAITVLVQLTDEGQVTNSWCIAAGWSHTPLYNMSVYSSDAGQADQYYNLTMRANTTYNFAVCVLTPFDPDYAQTNTVAIWADCAAVGGTPDYGVCYGGQLTNDPLNWHETWWGVADNGTYILHVKVASDGTFRVGLGITVTESTSYGNASAGDNQTEGTTLDDLLQNPVFQTIVGGVAILIIVPVVVGSRRRRSVQAGLVQRARMS
jgi:hypothetical protein